MTSGQGVLGRAQFCEAPVPRHSCVIAESPEFPPPFPLGAVALDHQYLRAVYSMCNSVVLCGQNFTFLLDFGDLGLSEMNFSIKDKSVQSSSDV